MDRRSRLQALQAPRLPLSGAVRSEACSAALEPELSELKGAMLAAGWRAEEVTGSLLILAIGELRKLAGDQATLLILEQAPVQMGIGRR